MTQRLFQAINFATKAHGEQKRYATHFPYITHPLAVALILSQIDADEDIVIAGILHDTIEDTETTYEDIQNVFGQHVAALVNDVTEQDVTLPWEDRERFARNHIQHMSHEALLIKTADIMHNLSDKITGILEKGLQVFNEYDMTSHMKDLEHNQLRLAAIKKSWPQNPLLPELEKIFSKFE